MNEQILDKLFELLTKIGDVDSVTTGLTKEMVAVQKELDRNRDTHGDLYAKHNALQSVVNDLAIKEGGMSTKMKVIWGIVILVLYGVAQFFVQKTLGGAS